VFAAPALYKKRAASSRKDFTFMKRVLLFLSSFIIVLGAAGALWLGLFATTFQREHFRATMGNAHAQHATAFLYMNGKAGAAKDEAAARRWYEKATKGGIDAAAFNLGLMLQRGRRER
jgi:TPR repeat protein